MRNFVINTYQLVYMFVWADGYSVKDIKYSWKDGPRDSVGIHEEVQLPQFEVRGHRAQQKLEVLTTGSY